MIEGYRIDPIVGFIAVKLDFLRSLRPEGDPIKEQMRQVGTNVYKVIEELFHGLPGYLVVTDAELRVEDFGTEQMTIRTSLKIEHTYVLKDGKYLCEWGDPANPISQGQPLQKKKPLKEEFIDDAGMPTIRYNL